MLRPGSVPRMPARVSPLTVASPATPRPTTTTLGAPVADARRAFRRNLAMSHSAYARPPAGPGPGPQPACPRARACAATPKPVEVPPPLDRAGLVLLQRHLSRTEGSTAPYPVHGQAAGLDSVVPDSRHRPTA